ncbi:MAG: RDD family protein [Opitutales bacterium]|nr:RDD family protein [Opitutales bacterium]MCH8540784.1 RDD family protein [Opitutales bacterium]
MSEQSFHQTPGEPVNAASPSLEPAPLLPRFSAFCADMCVIIFLFITVLYVVLPRMYPTESQALQEYQEEVAQHNEEAQRANQRGEDPPPPPEPNEDVLRYGNILHMSLLGIIFLYFFLGEKLSRGSSPGKMLFRLKVVLQAAPHRPLPGIVSALRALTKTAFFIVPPLLVLFAFVFFQPQRRGLHDLLARTILMRTMPPEPSAPEPPHDPAEPPLRTP